MMLRGQGQCTQGPEVCQAELSTPMLSVHSTTVWRHPGHCQHRLTNTPAALGLCPSWGTCSQGEFIVFCHETHYFCKGGQILWGKKPQKRTYVIYILYHSPAHRNGLVSLSSPSETLRTCPSSFQIALAVAMFQDLHRKQTILITALSQRG